MEQFRNAYRDLMERRRWEDNTKVDLTEVGCDAGNWIDLAQN